VLQIQLERDHGGRPVPMLNPVRVQAATGMMNFGVNASIDPNLDTPVFLPTVLLPFRFVYIILTSVRQDQPGWITVVVMLLPSSTVLLGIPIIHPQVNVKKIQPLLIPVLLEIIPVLVLLLPAKKVKPA